MIKRTILYMIIGGILGGILGVTFIGETEFDIVNYIDLWTVIVIVFTFGLFLFALSIYFSYSLKRSLKARGYETDNDEYQVWLYNRYLYMMYCIEVSMSIDFFSLCTIAFTLNRYSFYLFWAIVLSLIIKVFIVIKFLEMMNLIYPERNLPSVKDPKFQDKLFQASDDGEKHVMLNGLFSSYKAFNTTLVFVMVILFLYDMNSGQSQVVAIALITLTLIIGKTTYYLKIRDKL